MIVSHEFTNFLKLIQILIREFVAKIFSTNPNSEILNLKLNFTFGTSKKQENGL